MAAPHAGDCAVQYCETSMAQTMPLVAPLADTDGVAPGKLNPPVLLCEVGPLTKEPALKENAFKLSPAPAKNKLPFQYAGEPHIPPTALGSSWTICVSPVVQVVHKCPIVP